MSKIAQILCCLVLLTLTSHMNIVYWMTILGGLLSSIALQDYCLQFSTLLSSLGDIFYTFQAHSWIPIELYALQEHLLSII